MRLQAIKHRIDSLPTIMDISDEIVIIKQLMTVDADDLSRNTDIFKFIVEALWDSHMDYVFADMTEENESLFIDFSYWLQKINAKFNLEIHADTIDLFSWTVAEIKKMMS